MGDDLAATPDEPETTPSDDGSTTAGAVRIGDAERNAVVDMLSRHTGAGRLTLDEFADRAGRVFAARTWDDLGRVLADLPQELRSNPFAPLEPAGVSTDGAARPDGKGGPTRRAPADPARSTRRRRRFVAIMSGTSARGRWWAPHRIRAFAWWGGVKIDLRDAVITSPVVHVKASAYMGQVTIVVPEGIPVDMSGLVLMGGSVNHTRVTEPLPGAPLLQVKARGLWGGVVVRSGKRRPRDPIDRVEELTDRARDRLERGLEVWKRQVDQYRAEWERRVEAHPRWDDEAATGPDRRRSGAPSWWGCPGDHDRWAGHRGSAGRKARRTGRPPDEPARPRAADPAGETGSGSASDHGPPSGGLDDLEALAKTRMGDKLREVADRLDPGRTNGHGAAPEPAPNGARLPTGTMTMLVTDIVRSTQLAGSLGDRRWMELLRTHNRIVRDRVAEHGGTEVKAQGDGFLMVFPSARRAILAAVEVQEAMAKHRSDHPDHPVELRIGLHTGEVVTDDDDVHGQNVIIAVRIADAAAPNEILVSGLTRDLTASSGDFEFDPGRELSLKGLAEHRRAHAVLWEP